MGKLTRQVAYIIGCLIILEVGESISLSEVFSQIDLDSGETSDITEPPRASLKTWLDVNTMNSTVKRTPRIQESRAFVRSSLPGDTRRRRTCNLAHVDDLYERNEESKCTPTIINNIRIFVNGNESQAPSGSPASSCKNGVCNVSVSSRTDGHGNVVTDVHLSVVTSVNAAFGIEDIPVIDGNRGAENSLDVPATFHFVNQPRPVYASHVLRGSNVPQIEARRFYDRRNFAIAPPPTWYRTMNGENARKEVAFRPWQVPRVTVVDDKIDAPLSETDESNE